MTITYTWKVTDLKIQDISPDRPKAVVQTYWEKHGTDENGNTGFFAGATPFTVDPNDESGPFIPFEQLTEADVLAWVQSQVTGSYEEHVNSKIKEDIDEKAGVVVDAPVLPWTASPAE